MNTGFGKTGAGNTGLGNTGLGNTGLGNTGLGNTGAVSPGADTDIEEIRSGLAARRVAGSGRTFVIHADEGWVQPIREGKFDFFTRLAPRLAKEGLATRIVTAGATASKVLLSQDHVHVMVGNTPAYGRGILHAMPSYIWGFWYFDEVGAYWNSSLRFASFAPDQIDTEKAAYFFNGVAGYMLRANVSKTAQDERLATPMPPASAVVFCQEIETRNEGCVYLSTETMIRTCAEANRDMPVYVKLHPSQSKAQRRLIMAAAADYPHVKMSDASVHDLIAASACVVTQNSAAGFEALMQKKTVITCAKSDYWHATLTPKTVADLREALQYGPEVMKDFAFEKYFYWFLDRKCLETQKPEFAARAWARIAEKIL